MEKVKQIYQSFSKSEIRYFKNYLKAFQPNGENMALKLVKLIEKKPDISQDELSKKLYGDPKSKAFIMLKRRVYEKLKETMSLSINLENNLFFKQDPVEANIINLQKEITYGILLIHRGLRGIAQDVLERCVKKAGASGKPELEMIALLQLRFLIHKDEKKSKENNKLVNKALEKLKTDVKGSELYYDFLGKFNGKAVAPDILIPVLDEINSQFEDLLDDAYAPRTNGFKLQLKMLSQDYQQNFAELRNTASAYTRFLQDNPEMASKNRLANAYIRVATQELKMLNLEAMERAVQQALHHTFKPKRNFVVAKELLIRSCFLLNKLESMETMLGELDWYLNGDQYQGEARCGFIRLIQSSLHFVQRDFEKAYQLSESSTFLQNDDKQGWSSWLRIYDIQILIDQGKLDVATSKIENLRKHVAKYQPIERVLNIHKYLSQLERNAFDFVNPNDKMKALMPALSEGWQVLGAEVIRFDTWVRAKQQGKDFYSLFLEELEFKSS